MFEQLFRERSFHDWRDVIITDEANRLRSMALNLLESPTMSHHIEHAANRMDGEVPTLLLDKLRGTASGGAMHVHIPFSGNRSVFSVSPSSGVIVSKAVQIGRDELIVSFPDDGRVKQETQDIIKSIIENLENIKKDIVNARGYIRSQLQACVAQRISELRAQIQRDSDIGFPVTRS